MTDQHPHAASGVPHVTAPSEPRSSRTSFWIRELPFTIVLILTIAGVAYTSFSKKPIVVYWEILAPIIGLVCIGAGWQEAGDKAGRLRLVVTQALHWGAFLLVMNILLLLERAADIHGADHGAGDFHVAGARHFYRRRTGAVVAGLSARPDHGVGHSGHRLD